MPDRVPLSRVTAMPTKTNHYGRVFGAQLMKALKALVENPLEMAT